MAPGKNWAYIAVFLTGNRDEQTEYFTNTAHINKICLNLNQLVFCFQWWFQLLKHVSYHYAPVDLQGTGRKRWYNSMHIARLTERAFWNTCKPITNCIFRLILSWITIGWGARIGFESEASNNKFHRTPYQQYLSRWFSIPIEYVLLWTRNATFVTWTEKATLETTEKKNGRSSTYLKFWIKSGEYTAEAIKALDVCQMMFHNMNVSLLKLVILKFAP